MNVLFFLYKTHCLLEIQYTREKQEETFEDERLVVNSQSNNRIDTIAIIIIIIIMITAIIVSR